MITSGQLSAINEMKRKVFFEIIDMVGRVYIVVKESDMVRIGNRGFLQEEKEKGLILVFNEKMNFMWQNEILTCRLSFQSRPESCSIPANNIVAVYSPELKIQFSSPAFEPDEIEDEIAEEIEPSENVIKVDFSKKK